MSKITESARGEDCQIRLPGVCNFDPATTVWAHANGSAAGKGIGMKSHDALGSYACSNCHSMVDRMARSPRQLGRVAIQLAFHEGHQRSLIILIRKGLIKCT